MELRTVNRPWGMFREFTHNAPSTVKIITIYPGESLSLQYHHNRSEFWRVLEGTPIITIGKKIFQAKPGEEFAIPEETAHRIEAKDRVEILEISFGTFDEGDIVRLEDKYGRV